MELPILQNKKCSESVRKGKVCTQNGQLVNSYPIPDFQPKVITDS